MDETRETEAVFAPMALYMRECTSPHHEHFLLGTMTTIPPMLGEIVYMNEEQTHFFRPVCELLLSLN